MPFKYYIDSDGKYLGGWPEGHTNIPENSFPVNVAPDNAQKIWDFESAQWIYDVKINSLVNTEQRSKHFHDINYSIEVNLYPKRTFSYGALTQVIWYADDALTNPVVKVDISYNYNILNFATDRTVTRSWYKNDGTLCTDVKVTEKDYTINPQDQLDEAILRRTNNMRQTNLWLIGAVPGLTEADPNIEDRTSIDIRDSGVAFFEKFQVHATTYIETGSQLLEQDIIDEIDLQWDWFDTNAAGLGITGVEDVRDYIIYQLSSGQRNKNGDI